LKEAAAFFFGSMGFAGYVPIVLFFFRANLKVKERGSPKALIQISPTARL
jgi:hypothetical protein